MSLRTPLFSIFSKYPNLVVAFSTKQDGRMKIRYELENDAETLSNREKFLQKFSISNETVVSAKLVHMNTVAVVSRNDVGRCIEQTDGLVTNQQGAFLSITVCDCLPIFLFDPMHKAVGLLHAGWRGLDAHIILAGLSKMQKEFGSKPPDMLVGIGPGIDVCHFEVKEDVLNKFTDYQHIIRVDGQQAFLNLKQVAKQQLMHAGIQEDHIEISPLCTFCEKEMFYSFRRDKDVPVQAMMAVIGVGEETPLNK